MAAAFRLGASTGFLTFSGPTRRVRGMRLVGPLKVKKPVLAASLKPAATTPSPTRNKDT